MLDNLDKITHLRFHFDACPMHSLFGFVPSTHQNLSARALFCLNSLAKVNTLLLERMRTAVRHISYGIRHYPAHTLLSRMYGTITTLIPLYLVFQHFPIEMNRLSSSTHGTSALTPVFDSKHMDVKKNDRRH